MARPVRLQARVQIGAPAATPTMNMPHLAVKSPK
jgi:hypothetical protein